MWSLVLDTDVTSYIFKWHPLASAYLDLVKNAELVISFMTLAEMRFGALRARWGPARCDLLERYLADFPICYANDELCQVWARVTSESAGRGRPVSHADAWIAATAISLKVPLVTNNPSHFADQRNLEIRTVWRAQLSAFICVHRRLLLDSDGHAIAGLPSSRNGERYRVARRHV